MGRGMRKLFYAVVLFMGVASIFNFSVKEPETSATEIVPDIAGYTLPVPDIGDRGHIFKDE